jgi:hypothetical protein
MRARTADTVSREINKSYRNAKTLILQGLKKTTVGSSANLNHIRALADLDRRYRNERAERNLDSPNLGVALRKVYSFHAIVDGMPNSGTTALKARTAAEQLMIEELDREYATLPPPQVAPYDRPQVQHQTADDFELEEDDNEPEENLETWP